MCFFGCRNQDELKVSQIESKVLRAQRDKFVEWWQKSKENLENSIKEVDELKLRVKELEKQLDHSFCGNEQWYTYCLRNMPKCSDCNKKP